MCYIPFLRVVQNVTLPILAAGILQPLKRRLIIFSTIKRRFFLIAQYQPIIPKQAVKSAVKIKPKLKPIKAKFNLFAPIQAPKLNPN